MSLMDQNASSLKDRLSLPLAECIRPTTLTEYIGQHHLLGENGAIANFLWLGYLPSMILSGPPGVGKTTLASIMANHTGYVFVELSATNTTVNELREISSQIRAENSKRSRIGHARLRVVIFIDEIHRFSTTQQDFLLPFVEAGDFVFIGATSVDPNKRIRRAILSRCQVFNLEPLTNKDIVRVVRKAALYENIRRKLVGKLQFISYSDAALKTVAEYSNGDTRTAINCIELLSSKYNLKEHAILQDSNSDTFEVGATEVEIAVKSLTKARLGLRHHKNIPLLVQLFNCMNGVIEYRGTTESRLLVSSERKDNSYYVTIRIRDAVLALCDNDMDVKKVPYNEKINLEIANPKPSKHMDIASSPHQTGDCASSNQKDLTFDLGEKHEDNQQDNSHGKMRISKELQNGIVPKDSKLREWESHLDVSDDSDVEPGEIYSDSDNDAPSFSRISVSDFRSVAAVHTMLSLLQRDESVFFILKQLILFMCMYILADNNELPKIVAVLKALKQSATDPTKLLSTWVERLSVLPKVQNPVKTIRLIRSYCSQAIVKDDVYEDTDMTVVFDDEMERTLLEDIPSHTYRLEMSKFEVESDIDEEFSLGWKAVSPQDITLEG